MPNPQRCFHCQRYGHSALSFRGKTCAKCGKNYHPSENCSNLPCCINCGEPHPAYSRSCRKWKQEKEIITLKVKENISFPEARKRFSFLQKGPYSLMARAGVCHQSLSVETQVCPNDLVIPPPPPASQRFGPRLTFVVGTEDTTGASRWCRGEGCLCANGGETRGETATAASGRRHWCLLHSKGRAIERCACLGYSDPSQEEGGCVLF